MYGIESLLPAVVAISMALITRQVLISLLSGVFIGLLVLHQWNPWQAYLGTLDLIVSTLGEKSNTQVIVFTFLVGALIAMIQGSGGVQGFINSSLAFIQRLSLKQGLAGHRRIAQLMAMVTGIVVFVESNIGIMTTGTLFRPLFDQLRIARERLALIADTCAAPSKVAIPLNSWGVFIVGLIAAQGIEQPLSVMLQSIAYNIYPLLMLLIVLVTSITGKDVGAMRSAQLRTEAGKLLNDGAKPMISEQLLKQTVADGVPIRAINMLTPMLLMLVMVPVMLVWTGWDQTDPSSALSQRLNDALNAGSGSASITVAMSTALIVAALLYKAQNIMSFNQSIELMLSGMSTMMTMALVMLLAFVMGNLSNLLGTGNYVAEATSSWLLPALVPILIFLISCLVSFATGTSWGTFAIMLAIAIPVAVNLDVPVPLVVAAAVGGGVFGDHCSPISDTTIMSSMVSGTDHIDHVKTQMTYAIPAAVITLVIYWFLG